MEARPPAPSVETMKRIRIAVSSCLLGEKVRYDGRDKLDGYIRDVLGERVEFVAVCPEKECGLGVPREPMILVGDKSAPRLLTRETRLDHTERMRGWTSRKLAELEKEDLRGFIFKSDSPSCGPAGVKVYDGESVARRSGTGIFARAFIERFPRIPVEDEHGLRDDDRRARFIERVFGDQR